MTVVAYVVVTLVILVLCGLGLSIGLILRGKSLQKCGRVPGADGDGGCPTCGSGVCKKEKKA